MRGNIAQAPGLFDDIWNQPIRSTADRAVDIIEQIKTFNEFGTPTVETEEDGIPYYINEYWTSGQRQAHSIHEVSYRACFKPQLPAFFIDRLTGHGDVVHDPFMGRGTTPVQAALMGRRVSANDVNPLSTLLTRPRLSPPSLHQIAQVLGTIPWNDEAKVREDLLAFYHPTTLRQLTVLRSWLLEHAPISDDKPCPIADWIRMVSINRLTGHSPGFFSVYTLPPNQAVSVDSQLKINEKRNQSPPERDISKIILKKSKSLLSDGAPKNAQPSIMCTGQADRTPSICDASVDLVVTSPPFLDIVQYANDNWLRCWFAGIDAKDVSIAMHRTPSAWTEMVRKVLIEQCRILRSGGHVAFEVGEVRGGKVLLEKLVWTAAENLPLERLGVLVNQQEFTKTANCWGISNNKSGTNSNRIVIMRRT